MKLFTKAILAKLPPLYSQENVADPIAQVKLFNPTGVGTWFLTEYDPEEKIAFGLCHIHEAELGNVSIEELEQFRGRMGLGIERDLHFTPKPISECRKEVE